MGDYAAAPEHAPYYASVPPTDDYSRGYANGQTTYAPDQAAPLGKRLSVRQMGKTRDSRGYDAGAQDGEVDAGVDQQQSHSRTSSGFSPPQASHVGDMQRQAHVDQEEEEEEMYEQEHVEPEHQEAEPAPARGGIFSNITSSIGIFGHAAEPPPPAPVQEVKAT